MRRNFKLKVVITKKYGVLGKGYILESVTMRGGNYTGLLKLKAGIFKFTVPANCAEPIK